MKLIVGLGNIGPHYDGTRHNLGFAMLDAFAAKHGLEWGSSAPKHAALTTQGIWAGDKVFLAKPTTYYNASGEAVRSLLDFYKLSPQDVLVVHDELALSLGTIRARLGGTDAGNNGIKSIAQHLGPDFARLRLGIANELTPTFDAADFVLSQFTHDERQAMPALQATALPLIQNFADGQAFEHTSVHVNTAAID